MVLEEFEHFWWAVVKRFIWVVFVGLHIKDIALDDGFCGDTVDFHEDGADNEGDQEEDLNEMKKYKKWNLPRLEDGLTQALWRNRLSW